mgnify:CR=1 FL=1
MSNNEISTGLSQKNAIDLSSLDSILTPEVSVVENPNEDRFIIHSKQIDTKTIKRTRVKITPAVCTVCGFDIAKLAYEQNKLQTAEWNDLTPEVQSILEQAKLKHMQISHSVADNLIVTASQLKNNKKWLSSRGV